MITKITNDKQTYFTQFEAINDALSRSGSVIRVNSLEDYFSNIRTIAQLTKVGSDVKGKFLIMPLDEPFFKIDANARAIEIPANFKKNGIGVQNDHWAEILYFKVDRFYDYQDLASLNIFINWEFIPSGTRNGGSEGVKVSKAFAPDPDFEPNQLIFGWIIDRSMTPSKGVLKFSVSFADSAVPGVPNGYQLSTLISQVNINEGLVPAQDAELIAVNDNDFFARITNSAISAEGMNNVLEAVTWKPLPKKATEGKLIKLIPDDDANGIWVYSTGEENNSLFYPHNTNNNRDFVPVEKCYFPITSTSGNAYTEQETLTLAAEAVSPDMVDSIDYLWATSFSTSDTLEDAHFQVLSTVDNTNNTTAFKFVATNDTVFNANTTYWKKQGNNLIALSSTEAQTILEANANAEQPSDVVILYERIGLYTVNRGGYYTVRAQSSMRKEVNTLTEDTSVQAGKTYRRLETEGANAGTYVSIEDGALTGNPKEQGWYELSYQTCNSPIKYSEKFIHIPNAEVPQVVITATNRYTPIDGDYTIKDNNGEYTTTGTNTIYNYIDVNRTEAKKPLLQLTLTDGNGANSTEGIGGIAWTVGHKADTDYLVVDGVSKSLENIMRDSPDRDNSDFAQVGPYYHMDTIDLDYPLYNQNQEETSEEYHVRVFNQRNHTYTVTPDITAMTLSYVAPKISAFDVKVKSTDASINNTYLLLAGETPREHNLIKDFNLTDEHNSLTITLAENFGEADSAVNELLSHYALDELTYKYFLEEVNYNPESAEDNEKRMNNRKALGILEDNRGRGVVEFTNINEEVTIPDNDTGYYRIRIETYYHDTKSVAYTDMFHVIQG